MQNTINHIYLHYPFCLKKCDYCSFHSLTNLQLQESYIECLEKEIILRKKQFSLQPHTVYFGGGTPSLMNNAQINKILSYFDLTACQEITLEVNPVTVDLAYFEDLRATQVNRISIGAQSFLDKELKLLGRLHNAENTRETFKYLRDLGYTNISLDYMYGLPKQKKKDILISLEEYLKLDPEHISIYCLSLEEGTPLFEKNPQLPKDEVISDFYHLIRETLTKAGYLQYEISNFAKPGFESQHNLSYWSDKYYLGLGASASGYYYNTRYNNYELETYLNALSLNEYPCEIEVMEEEEHEKEYIFLSLRKSEGLNFADFETKFGYSFRQKYAQIISKFLSEGMLEVNDNFVFLTPQAYFVSNSVFCEFV